MQNVLTDLLEEVVRDDVVKDATESSRFSIIADETVGMEVASSWPDLLPTLLAAKTSELSLLVKLPLWWRSGRCRHCCSVFLTQCAGNTEAENTDSGIAMDCGDRNRETLHHGD